MGCATLGRVLPHGTPLFWFQPVLFVFLHDHLFGLLVFELVPEALDLACRIVLQHLAHLVEVAQLVCYESLGGLSKESAVGEVSFDVFLSCFHRVSFAKTHNPGNDPPAAVGPIVCLYHRSSLISSIPQLNYNYLCIKY